HSRSRSEDARRSGPSGSTIRHRRARSPPPATLPAGSAPAPTAPIGRIRSAPSPGRCSAPAHGHLPEGLFTPFRRFSRSGEWRDGPAKSRRPRMFPFTRVALVSILSLLAAGAAAASSFVNFESGHVRPLALSPDGSRLFAVNTPDNRLAVYDVTDTDL